MEVPAPSDNTQVEDDQGQCQALISPNPSPAVQVAQCLYNNPEDNAISQVPPQFDCQAAKNPEDQCTLSDFSDNNSPSSVLPNDVSAEFVELLKNTWQSMEKDLSKSKMLLKENKEFVTQLENLYSYRERELIKVKRRIDAMEAINDLKNRFAINTGIMRKLVESINASKDEFISHSENGEENHQKEKTEGLAVEHGVDVSTSVTVRFKTMQAQIEAFWAIDEENIELESALNTLLKKYEKMKNNSKECDNDGKPIKLGVSSGKQVPRKLNGVGMETLMGASSSSSTHSSPSNDERSDVSSSDKYDVKMQDAETTEVSMEADPSPTLNPSNAENGGNPHITE